jgi:hypothetical protein
MVKLPNPVKVTRFPSLMAASMDISTPFNPRSAVSLLIFADFAMAATRSFLFMGLPRFCWWVLPAAPKVQAQPVQEAALKPRKKQKTIVGIA